MNCDGVQVTCVSTYVVADRLAPLMSRTEPVYLADAEAPQSARDQSSVSVDFQRGYAAPRSPFSVPTRATSWNPLVAGMTSVCG